MKRACVLAAVVLFGQVGAVDDVLRLEASEPRAYGYQVGDLVQRRVRVHAPEGWQFDETSLPRPGGRGQALELRRIELTTRSEHAGRRHDMAFEYQVFLAPASVRTIEIAPLRLRFEREGHVEDLLVEAWPVTVAPLVPTPVSPRRGLGELQPDREPALIDTSIRVVRLCIDAASVAGLLGWLAFIYLGPPWRAARQQPFGRAWRQLRHLPNQPLPKQWREACVQFHEAINRCAGEVLFESGLERFIARRPAFRGLHDDLQRFMSLSRAEFFAEATRAPADAAWLVSLCRRCRDAERGLV